MNTWGFSSYPGNVSERPSTRNRNSNTNDMKKNAGSNVCIGHFDLDHDIGFHDRDLLFEIDPDLRPSLFISSVWIFTRTLLADCSRKYENEGMSETAVGKPWPYLGKSRDIPEFQGSSNLNQPFYINVYRAIQFQFGGEKR